LPSYLAITPKPRVWIAADLVHFNLK